MKRRQQIPSNTPFISDISNDRQPASSSSRSSFSPDYAEIATPPGKDEVITAKPAGIEAKYGTTISSYKTASEADHGDGGGNSSTTAMILPGVLKSTSFKTFKGSVRAGRKPLTVVIPPAFPPGDQRGGHVSLTSPASETIPLETHQV